MVVRPLRLSLQFKAWAGSRLGKLHRAVVGYALGTEAPFPFL